MTVLPERYQFVTNLNKGSYGVVSLAKDTNDNDKLVAIKSIRSSADAKQEIAVHQILDSDGYHHPNISKVIDHFVVDQETFLVMEYYQQGDLYEAIRAGRGPREQNCIQDFMCQLIEAVEYCHSKGVYHRDIKPENVLMDDGIVKLCDFGLSTNKRICTDFGVGSERYMAPELLDQANTSSYDASKVDIWSIGICLLNILFCRNPFTVASEKDKLFMDFASNREALFDIFPTLSNDTFAVLRHCLTLDPDNRDLTKLKQELLAVQSWTIDDDYYDEDDDDVFEVQEESEEQQQQQQHAEEVEEFITTTTNRQPLRTPSIDVVLNYNSDDYTKPWIRTMQFTPPTVSTFHAKMHKPSGLRHYSMESVTESEEEADEESADDDKQQDEDIFVMDINTPMSKMSIRNSSDNGSIDSIPSLVQSTASSQLSSSVPALTIPHSKTPPNREFLKFGTSWSDLAFEDDDFYDDNQFIQFQNESKMPGAKDIKAGLNKLMN